MMCIVHKLDSVRNEGVRRKVDETKRLVIKVYENILKWFGDMEHGEVEADLSLDGWKESKNRSM